MGKLVARMVPVILADVVSSRRVESFRAFRDERLTAISEAHRKSGWTAHDYAVTAGDEFQNVLAAPAVVPAAIFDLRRRFRPLDLWIAVGIGAVETLPRADEPVNVAGTGEAFEMARAAMAYLRAPSPDAGASRRRLSRKYRFLTALRSPVPGVDTSVDIAYRLLDTLLRGTTSRQWETIDAYEEHGRLDEAARALGIDESTASRNLGRAAYWQARDTITALGELLSTTWP